MVFWICKLIKLMQKYFPGKKYLLNVNKLSFVVTQNKFMKLSLKNNVWLVLLQIWLNRKMFKSTIWLFCTILIKQFLYFAVCTAKTRLHANRNCGNYLTFHDNKTIYCTTQNKHYAAIIIIFLLTAPARVKVQIGEI